MSPRDFALHSLDHKALPGWPTALLRPARNAPSDPRDRALAEQLTIGVVKNLLHLRRLTEHHSGRSLRSIDPLAQKIIAIALYQLRFLSRIPAAAAVNEAVEQARRFGRARAGGFINAVLRNSARNPDPAWPDRIAAPADYAEQVLSHPRELFGRFLQLMPADQALALCEHDNAQPPTLVRLRPGVSPEALQHPGVTIAPHEDPTTFVVTGATPAILADWAARGLAQAQDPTAARAVEALDLQPGQRILDRCCGLGTKTLQIRSLAGPDSSIVAVDPSSRIDALLAAIEQRGLANVKTHRAGMMDELPEDQRGPFDRILIDAPCSNSGVVARRPEARYRQSARDIASVTRLQDRILDDTTLRLAPGGLLVYSTCSIWPEENEQRMAAFLSRHPGYRLLRQETMLPSIAPDPARYHDGGYMALFTNQ